MFALFEESGRFHAGRVLSETDASAQVELDSGKRVKAKAAQLLLRFATPAPAALMVEAERLAAEIDLDLAWEFAPEGEFGFVDLARDYYGAQASLAQQAAALLRLFDAPHYFRRLGRGQFRKAPQETVRAALLGIERKKQQAAQVDAWAQSLAAGDCPPTIREQLYRILFKPDKNAPEYKAVVEASRRSQRSPLDLLKAAGAIDSPYQFHWRRFLFEHFPRGTGFPELAVPTLKEELPRAEVAAFSIDDSSTTEIDDALSVRGLGSGQITLGIHIAAPGLLLQPDGAMDKLARDRLSTVYLPGGKITMLPDAWVAASTLQEGRDCAALSLYTTIDESSLERTAFETRIERVPIVANLRHDQLEERIGERGLADAGTASAAGIPFAAELAFLWRLASQLKAEREQVRGKPELFNRPDYSFRLTPAHEDGPRGDEAVAITPRRRGSPLDLVVAEAMIHANCHWGGWLASLGVPGIYRSQASLAPGIKVRMGTKPAPHAGMGVPQYAWSTSPLRRYVDLVNQWQLIAAVRHGRTAALAAPFKPKDAQLLAVISSFDAAYGAYGDFQSALERFWTLRHLQQQAVQELDAAVMKDGWVRADTLPLVLRAQGAESLPRGARVRIRVQGVDLMTLDASAQVLARLDTDAAVSAIDPGADLEEDTPAAGPVQLAIDVSEDSVTPLSEPGAAIQAPTTSPS
jgi:exoribonuclease II